MEELISIVLPIYNVEKYLEDCIKSVINQTYKNIEIILVNDGSTDSSLDICKKYSEIDNRIKIINKENGGLSDARNNGIEVSSGKYICFIDSDDYINEKYIEILYREIKKNNVKISMCNFQRVNENNELKEFSSVPTELIEKRKFLKNFNDTIYYPASVVAWNKMYDIKLFEDIKYPYGKIHEDEFTTYKLIYNSDNIAITNEKLYYYRIVKNSITNKNFNIKRLDIIEALEEKMFFYKINNEDYLYKITLIEYESILLTLYYCCKTKLKNSSEYCKSILKKYKKVYKDVIKLGECGLKNKIKFKIAKTFPFLYCQIRHLKDIV